MKIEKSYETSQPIMLPKQNVNRARRGMRSTKTNLVARRANVPAHVRRETIERPFRIHEMIAAGKYPNAQTIAKELEVSPKTIVRDLQFMRDRLDLPIEYHPQRHGFYYSKPVAKFPGSVKVTESELFALLVAHKAIEQYKGTPFYQPLLMAFAKLTGQLDRKERYTAESIQEALSFRPFAPEDTDVEIFQIVTRALQDHRALKFEYRKPGQKSADMRDVHPYHLTCIDNRWYLLAYDMDRSDIRTFVLGRTTNPRIGDPFTKPKDFDPDKYFDGSFGAMKGTGDYEVVIEFDAFATDQLRGRKWHPTQVVTELPGGGSQMRMRLSGLEEIERWILSWGTHANAVYPKALVDRIRQTVHDLSIRYGTVQND
ncbi:MAG: hypothetical protein JWO95_1525 [Verrucomicrobiales bacterium]|nr:hypothetical protein [Verrucomicrobiales bacterium]